MTADTLDRLDPEGSGPDEGRAGDPDRLAPARAGGYKTATIDGEDLYELAAEIDRFFSAAKGKPSADVIIATGERAEYAMPAAAWAARSGDAVLFAKRDEIPRATVEALERHEKPNIFVLGPERR